MSDEVEMELRRRAARIYGAGRGVLSKAVEEAIKLWLSRGDVRPQVSGSFYALKDGRKVAEAESLRGLAQKLKLMGISVREVEVVSDSEPSPRSWV